MSQNQERILSRLLEKLTAVRATLKKDERAILDAMVLNANIMTTGFEVMQHGMKEGLTPAAEAAVDAGAATPRMDFGPDEVVQHGLKEGLTPAVDAGAVAGAASQYFKIRLDDASESYRLAD